MDVQRAVFRSGVLFGVPAIGVCPVFCRIQEGGVAVGADELQRLPVLAVFVAGVAEEGLNGLAGLVLSAVPAGDVASGQTAFLHPAFGPALVPGAVQVPRLAALAGFQILAAGAAVGAAAADFLCTINREELPSER